MLVALWSGACSFMQDNAGTQKTWFTTRAGARYFVHDGFKDHFIGFVNNGLNEHVDRCISSGADIIWIGHSLGGAVASLARLYYGRGKIYTFGGPLRVPIS